VGKLAWIKEHLGLVAQSTPTHYLRSRDGAEIDLIVERQGALVPIEVKWTERPDRSDARHLLTFMQEHPQKARQGFVICRCPRPMRLADRVIALPWFSL
jgi:predicted AAA+ superfamily ATPase